MVNNLTLLLITSENESLILVLQNNSIFVAGCLLQHHSDVIYIESLDTTGLIYPRESQKDVVFSLISYVCKLDSSIVSVFSIPKKETIFGKSELNPSKGCYTPKRLESFWRNHFTNLNLGKVHTYSNLTKEKSFPYKLIDQIRMFDDNPKRKTKIDEQEISLFYQSLLYRADFIKGSLIYLEKKEINSFAKECVFEENSVVRRALSFLRNGDFSNLQNGKGCTSKFMNMFYYEKIEFDFLKCKIVKEIEENVIFLSPVKKNNKNI